MNGPYAEHIRRLVDAAPPLSDAQRSRLATILRQSAIGRQPAPNRSLAARSAA